MATCTARKQTGVEASITRGEIMSLPKSGKKQIVLATKQTECEVDMNFNFLNAGFRSFSAVLVFHSFLELFIDHDQWMRLIFDTVNDV